MIRSNMFEGKDELGCVLIVTEDLRQCLEGILLEGRQKALEKTHELKGRQLANLLAFESNVQACRAWERFPHPNDWVLEDEKYGWFMIRNLETGLEIRLHATAPSGKLRRLGNSIRSHRIYNQLVLFGEDEVRTLNSGYPDLHSVPLVLAVNWSAIREDSVFAWIVRPEGTGTWKDGVPEHYRIPLDPFVPNRAVHETKPDPTNTPSQDTNFDHLLGKSNRKATKKEERTGRWRNR